MAVTVMRRSSIRDNQKFNAISADVVSGSCQYLVIAGGGGAGRTNTNYGHGGGGGAGGYRSSVSGESSGGGASAESTVELSTGAVYDITIGAGGVGGGTTYGIVTSGNDSVFGSITSVGGGRGSDPPSPGQRASEAGGSGGGNAYGAGSPGTANQGYAGGNTSGGNYTGGGGGGAAGVGTNGTTSQGGLGGPGVASGISGSSVTRAAGGTARAFTPAGAANTGNGGAKSTAGGSGTVILKYPNNIYLNVSPGLASSTTFDGSFKITQFTSGIGTFSVEKA